MSTLSVPLPNTLATFVEDMVKSGMAANKAEVVRQALTRYAEDQAVEAVLRSEQEARDGKLLSGDLRQIAQRLP
jgi:Arc/MetJ-type ribon-helix-helix transcriptional regulator